MSQPSITASETKWTEKGQRNHETFVEIRPSGPPALPSRKSITTSRQRRRGSRHGGMLESCSLIHRWFWARSHSGGVEGGRGAAAIGDDRPATHEASRGAGSYGETFCQRGALSSRLSTPMRLPRLPHTPPSCACTRAVPLCNDTTGTHPPRGPPSPGTRLSLYFPAHKFISWESAGQLAWGPREDEGHWILRGSARSTGKACEAFINGSRSSREGHDCGRVSVAGSSGQLGWAWKLLQLCLWEGRTLGGGECFCSAWYSELWMRERFWTRHTWSFLRNVGWRRLWSNSVE